jgi:hypothetical protein
MSWENYYICPVCGGSYSRDSGHAHPVIVPMFEHNFVYEPETINISSNANAKKWRCTKCLEMRWTYD